MKDKSDVQLLREYADHGNEIAFRELVLRHTDFVYSAAFRQVDSAAVASDLAQAVFTDLARKAGPIASKMTVDGSLAGWLHRSTRYLALNHLRDARRRRDNERHAMEQLLTNSGPTADWEQIRPALDEALDSLDDADREALLLRYFKNQDFRTVGAQLGVSDDTAQKRVSRAVERLREFFAKRGVTVGASGLVVAISANAVQAAPVGLAVTISAAAISGTTATASTFISATTKTIAMTTLQKAVITTTVAVLAGVGIYHANQSANLRNVIESLERQTPLLEDVQKLADERDQATNRLAGMADELAAAKKSNLELLKLRGEVGMLRQQTNRLGRSVQVLSTTLASVNSPSEPVEQTSFPRESWTFAGLATPEATLQSFMWAKNRGDIATAFSTATPELAQEQKDLYFKDKSDGEISAMMIDSASKQTGFQIVKKMVAADDQVIFQIHIDGMPEKAYSLLTLKKIADEWKVSGVEERTEKPFTSSK